MVEGCAWRNWRGRLCFLQWCLVMARDGNGGLQDGLTFLSPSNVIADTLTPPAPALPAASGCHGRCSGRWA